MTLTLVLRVLEEINGSGKPTISKPMKIRELDSVECNIEKTTNPSLLLMCLEVEYEDMILSLSHTAAMTASEQAEILAQVAFEVRQIYNPDREAVLEMLKSLPKDPNGSYSFADVQRVVMEVHLPCAIRFALVS